MNKITTLLAKYENGEIDKEAFIKLMHKERHSVLFEYSNYLSHTNIKKIEIQDMQVVMTSRDRGIQIECAPSDHRIAPIETLNFFDYEKDESKMMENLVGDNDYFFDIGANIGWYSLNIGIAKRGVKVFSFEPVPHTYNQLLRNLKFNPCENITPFNFGFSKKSGDFDFYYYPEGSGNASSANLTDRADVERILCKVSTLDEFIQTSNLRIDFIKCDVEGAELFVFQGGLEVIKRNLPIVFSEILRKWSAKFGYNPNEIFKFFSLLGYRTFTVKDNYLVEFYEMDESTVSTNFFFLHAQKHSHLIKRFLREVS